MLFFAILYRTVNLTTKQYYESQLSHYNFFGLNWAIKLINLAQSGHYVNVP